MMTNREPENARPRVGWFVGAFYNGTDDQTQRFVAEGIWENGYRDKYLDLVRSMRAGDRIAIKSSYVRKNNLPFDSRGLRVSVMAVKAIGTITENPGDGRHVRVNWTEAEPVREWYFYTNRGTVWRVLPEDWMSEGLIAFAFDRKPQDIDRFRNAPNWQERFGTTTPDKRRFGWTKFYEAVADKLLLFRNKRPELIEGIREISLRVEGLGHLKADQYADGTTDFIRDICPFTTMGLFNRGTTESNRKIIATNLAKLLGVDEPVPNSFEGIPTLNPQNSWYFGFEKDRQPDHIDALWDVFATSIKFADSEDEEARIEFIKAFDSANGRKGVAWNLTFGLYWIRPWRFLGLDHNSKVYVSKKLAITIGLHGPKKRCSAADYLAVMDTLEARFQEASYPVHSYPELSLEAWTYKDPTEPTLADDKLDEYQGSEDEAPDVASKGTPIAYAIEDIMREGCFLDSQEILGILERIREKKNLILQGPPGTGKTWLAKRLAFALIGQKDESKVRVVQFHPNLSYEDFVRGWRPTGDGKLCLVDGVFMEVIKAASKNASPHVVVIEEINRGNPAQIFGELLTLLEAGKRSPRDALELCYPDPDGIHRAVHIPRNVFVIGTMNIADRSLALVDLAFRRRFAFVDLKPKLAVSWRSWIVEQCNVDSDLVPDIERRITELNDQITSDARLGEQFCIGHSYVTPSDPLKDGGTQKWFGQVVATEIGPLLKEYWFDAPDESRKAYDRLLQGW
jgi:5-methylcytosine-specific restriction protein B